MGRPEIVGKYPLLRFYCDWSVHTEKDRITTDMKLIMNEIYNDIHDQITNNLPTAKKTNIIAFAYMEDLQAEMEIFFYEYGLKLTLFDTEHWISFVSLLVSVLADQPIKKPCSTIEEFSFLPAASGSVRGEVLFTNKIDTYDKYTFGNEY